MANSIAILGAGILGRSLAYRFSQEGFTVDVFEARSRHDDGAASFIAGGMLAPYCELEFSPEDIAAPGLRSISILKKWHEELDGQFWFQQEGSLVVCHPRDRSELNRLKNRLITLGHGDVFEGRENGIFFPDEAHVHTNSLMNCLLENAEKNHARFYFETKIDEQFSTKKYDWVIDCRGIGGKHLYTDLRGIRGEVAEIQTKEVSFKHPVRLMHPRYPVYVIPRPDHRFIIGATVVESEKDYPVTVRAALELLSAAATIEPAFAEATIIGLRHQIRPVFPNHLPRITINENKINVNGLYRHGYLFSPYITEHIVKKICDNQMESISCLELF